MNVVFISLFCCCRPTDQPTPGGHKEWLNTYPMLTELRAEAASPRTTSTIGFLCRELKPHLAEAEQCTSSSLDNWSLTMSANDTFLQTLLYNLVKSLPAKIANHSSRLKIHKSQVKLFNVAHNWKNRSIVFVPEENDNLPFNRQRVGKVSASCETNNPSSARRDWAPLNHDELLSIILTRQHAGRRQIRLMELGQRYAIHIGRTGCLRCPVLHDSWTNVVQERNETAIVFRDPISINQGTY